MSTPSTISTLLVAVCICASNAFSQQDNGPAPNGPLPSGAVLHLKPAGDDSTVYQLRFSPSGRLLATRDMEQVVRVWEMPGIVPKSSSGTERFALSGHVDRIASIEFSLDERLLVTASPGPNEQIHVWNMQDGNLLRRIQDQPSQLAFDADGSLITAGPKGFATYDVRSGQPLQSRRLSLPKRFTTILAISPRQNLIAYMISTQIQKTAPYEVFIRDLETGAVVHHETNPNQVASVEIAPDGKHAAICYRSRKDGVSIVSLTSNVPPFLLPDHKRQTLVARFSPDGRILATASWDGLVRIWDVLAGVQIGSVTASSGHALAVDFSSGNRWIATTGAGQQGVSTLVWDMRRLVFGIIPDASGSPNSSTSNVVSALATRQAVDAYRAIGQLISMGGEGVELARRFIDPLTVRLSDDEIDRLVIKLGSDSYQERQSAYQSLLRVRRLAAERLTTAMRRASTLEIELRLKRLLSTNAMTSLVSDSEYRQLYRLVQYLELSGDGKSRLLISKLARGHADGRVSELASESLKRLATGSESDRGA